MFDFVGIDSMTTASLGAELISHLMPHFQGCQTGMYREAAILDYYRSHPAFQS